MANRNLPVEQPTAAKSPEELAAIAKEQGEEITAELATAFIPPQELNELVASEKAWSSRMIP